MVRRDRGLPVLREKELLAAGVNVGPLRRITVVLGRAGGGKWHVPAKAPGWRSHCRYAQHLTGSPLVLLDVCEHVCRHCAPMVRVEPDEEVLWRAVAEVVALTGGCARWRSRRRARGPGRAMRGCCGKRHGTAMRRFAARSSRGRLIPRPVRARGSCSRRGQERGGCRAVTRPVGVVSRPAVARGQRCGQHLDVRGAAASPLLYIACHVCNCSAAVGSLASHPSDEGFRARSRREARGRKRRGAEVGAAEPAGQGQCHHPPALPGGGATHAAADWARCDRYRAGSRCRPG
ncbi:hypothetical protein SPARM206S_00414 [Streptomyces parvulus]